VPGDERGARSTSAAWQRTSGPAVRSKRRPTDDRLALDLEILDKRTVLSERDDPWSPNVALTRAMHRDRPFVLVQRAGQTLLGGEVPRRSWKGRTRKSSGRV